MSEQPVKHSDLPEISPKLLGDIRQMIEETRAAVAATVNAGLTMLYWRVGRRISQEILKGTRAEYGAEIVSTLARQLTTEYGRGFEEKNLRRMIQFAEVFPNEEIVVSLIRQLSWTHIIALIPLKQPLQREFYAEMCRMERWSVRTLRQKIASMLYERTALSKKYGANEAAELDDKTLPRYIRITDVDENGQLRDETFKSLPEQLLGVLMAYFRSPVSGVRCPLPAPQRSACA